MTEIKVIIKDFPADVDDPKAMALIMENFYQEPYEVFINGKKQTNIQRFAIDLPLDSWGKNSQYHMDNTGWKYVLEKKLNVDY